MSEVLRAVLDAMESIKPGLELHPDMPLRGSIDSLDALELVARVEQHFRVPVPDEDWRRMTSPRDIADYVAKALESELG